MLIVGAIADNVFYDSEPVVVVKMGEGKDRVQVNLQVAPDGVRIQAPSEKKSPSPHAEGEPSVKIDDKGLRIMAGDKDKRVAVVIDEKGVRVERNPPERKKNRTRRRQTRSRVSRSRKTGTR